MLTQCEAHGAEGRHPYGVDRSVFAVMNSAQSKDDWVKAQQHKFHKPIDVDTLMWVRNRLMRLEVEARWADRICVFEEFFPNDAIIPRI
jgi:hypothetical protein